MVPKTKQLVDDCERRSQSDAPQSSIDVRALCFAVKEQDKRARHAEEERDLLSKRIDELESENAQWRKDVEDAAGELLITIPKPGTEASKMLLANRAMRRERDASNESNVSFSRKLGELSEMLAAYGLPSEPKALAGAIERERAANRNQIVELEKEVASLRIIGETIPTNESFVRVAMAEHCTPSAMDDRYVQEWSRRFDPALDIIRARVSFKVSELEAKLAEAIDLAGEAIPYVSDYFREKYEMDERLTKLLPSLVRIKADEIRTRTASGKTVG